MFSNIVISKPNLWNYFNLEKNTPLKRSPSHIPNKKLNSIEFRADNLQ